MGENEIMNCAAILAAGIMANLNGVTNYDSERAIDLMEEIASEIERRQRQNQYENEEWL